MNDWDDFYERQCPDLNSLMNSLFAGIDISMPKRCLACGTLGTLHAYYHSRGAGKPGGFWMWCSACRRFLHASSIPPKWWQNLGSVQAEKLCAEPTYLEERADEIDRHWRSLSRGR